MDSSGDSHSTFDGIDGNMDMDMCDIYVKNSDESPSKSSSAPPLVMDMSSSWADLVEEEMSDSFVNKEFIKSSREEDEPNTTDTYLNMDPTTLTDLKILEIQTQLSNHVRKQLRFDDEQVDTQPLLKIISWLLKGSQILSNRLHLTIIHHRNTTPTHQNSPIPRSSYKFCNYNYECDFNYNFKKFTGCYAQHFVHNMIFADIESLKNYMEFHKVLEEKSLGEVRKSINTISFVFNHMHDELKNAKSFYCLEESKIHQERTPSKKNKKPRRNTQQMA